MFIKLATVFGVIQFSAGAAGKSLDIDTTSGIVQGFINEKTPHVAQFLGIPFAEQPVGPRRWLPPLRKSKESAITQAKSFGHACPQPQSDENAPPNIYLSDAPEFMINPESYQGEDCLSVNVWLPWNASQGKVDETTSLPVLVWLYGGGFTSGGGSVPYQNPSQWIERSRKHIVVGINYRLGIFGFPNAAGLPITEQNLGLLDQRLGIEWVRDNIANFGGDPNRITLWGQSAGAISADDYNFAYPKDPIVSSFILNSGTSLLPLANPDIGQTNFTSVAKDFGCGNRSAEAEIDCMRNVNTSAIISYLKAGADTGTSTVVFSPIVDNRTRFSNYTERVFAADYTRKPAIIGTTTNEGAGFFPYNRESGPDQTGVDLMTAQYFLCPSGEMIKGRYATNSTTFRYLYGGNFSNIAPLWWMNAYHSSDLPLIFGTYGIARGNGTEFQKRVSEKMQDYWLAFAEDPINGLPILGWNKYEPNGEAVLVGYGDKVVQSIAQRDLDAPCNGTKANGLPLPP